MSGGMEFLNGVLIILGVLGVALAVVWFRFAEYRVQRHWLEVRLGEICIRKFLFQDIENAEPGGTFPAAFWPTRCSLAQRRLATIHLRRGWIRRVIITPDDPERFCREFRFSMGRGPKPESPANDVAA